MRINQEEKVDEFKKLIEELSCKKRELEEFEKNKLQLHDEVAKMKIKVEQQTEELNRMNEEYKKKREDKIERMKKTHQESLTEI